MHSLTSQFVRHQPRHSLLPSLTAEAERLGRFVPPFCFTGFFAPEDTLLCVLAAEGALSVLRGHRARGREGTLAANAGLSGERLADDGAAMRIVELTTGSGLVGLRLLDLEPQATLLGVDIDDEAPRVARANAGRLGLADRARFERASIWERTVERNVRAEPVDLLVCNPPYIPEPPGGALPVEAGAGPDGAAHIRRVIEIASVARPTLLALSWCSLCDPAGIVEDAEQAGYELNALFVVAIGDGEYSGGVHSYLRGLHTAFLSELPHVVAEVAPDGSARFAYLLLAGIFSDARMTGVSAGERVASGASAAAVDRLVRHFVQRGTGALTSPSAPFVVKAWLLDRWDEIALRAVLHGPVNAGSVQPNERAAVPVTPTAPAAV